MINNNKDRQPRLFEVDEFITYQRKVTKTNEEFVNKFKFAPQNGSDECYTPPIIYECIKDYVLKLFPEYKDKQIIRPFKLNGDFTAENYNNAIVIDNPPFSILSNIINYYNDRDIKFWLFAPALTIMQYYNRCDIILANVAIKYHNGANISTSFVSNMFGDKRLILDGVLQYLIKELQNIRKAKAKSKYPYILSGVRLGKFIVPNEIKEISITDTLPKQSSKYNVFGNGCYIRKGCLPCINADKSELTEAEKLYLKYNNFEPIC